MTTDRLDDAGLDEMIDGLGNDGSAPLRELFAVIRAEAAATPPCVPSPELQRYLRPPSTPSAARGRPRRSRVTVGAAAFAGTLAGKLVLGATVAAASVGVAHYAEVIEVPGLPARPVLMVPDVVEPAGDVVSGERDPSGEELPGESSGEGSTSGSADAGVGETSDPDALDTTKDVADAGSDVVDGIDDVIDGLVDSPVDGNGAEKGGGCETGQVNPGRSDSQGGTSRPVDPCDRSEEVGSGGPAGDSGASDEDRGEDDKGGAKSDDQGENGADGQSRGETKASGPQAAGSESEAERDDGDDDGDDDKAEGSANPKDKKPKD